MNRIHGCAALLRRCAGWGSTPQRARRCPSSGPAPVRPDSVHPGSPPVARSVLRLPSSKARSRCCRLYPYIPHLPGKLPARSWLQPPPGSAAWCSTRSRRTPPRRSCSVRGRCQDHASLLSISMSCRHRRSAECPSRKGSPAGWWGRPCRQAPRHCCPAALSPLRYPRG